MTREVDTGPGVSDYQSARYAATVGGAAVYVYACEKAMSWGRTGLWDPGELVEVSETKFGSDEDIVEVVVTSPTVGPITSAVLYPNDRDIEFTVAGGSVTIQVPADTELRLEVNGDRMRPLYIRHAGLAQAEPVGAAIYDGSQLSCPDGTHLIFPAGVWVLPGHSGGAASATNPPMFSIGDSSVIHLRRGAVVIGNFDCVNAPRENWTIQGPGNMYGTWTTHADVLALPAGWTDQIKNAMVRGWGDFPNNSTVRDITMWAAPFFFIRAGNNAIDVSCYAPWWENTDAITVWGDSDHDYQGIIRNPMIWVSDDAVHVNEELHAIIVDGGIISTIASAIFVLSYWARYIENLESIIGGTKPVCVISFANYHNDALPTGESGNIVKAWLDGSRRRPGYGRANVRFSDLRVYGPCDARWFTIGNHSYIWDDTLAKDDFGLCYALRFDKVWFEEAPSHTSALLSLSAEQTPHCITFGDVTIGGRKLSARNFSEFVTMDSDFFYGIEVAGRTLVNAVDICNAALAAIGCKSAVTSIDPVDGSAEARHCARFYPLARDAVLSSHDWAFARVRAVLTDLGTDTDSYLYAYEPPADMLRPVAILPQGATDDYIQQAEQLPATPPTRRVLPALAQRVPRDFQPEVNSSGVQVLYSNEPDATLRYTKFVTDATQFEPLFVEAVTYDLAAKLAGVIIGGKDGLVVAREMRGMAAYALSRAKTFSAKNRQNTRQLTPRGIAAR